MNFTTAFDRLSRICVARPWRVATVAMLLCAAAIVWTVGHFAINTDTARLISAKADWRQGEIAFDAAFPGRTDLIVAVIDAADPEQADRAVEALDARLRETGAYRSVTRPDSGPFFDKYGLLLQDEPDFRATISGLVRQQPFLSLLAAEPSFGGVLEAIALGLRGVASGEAKLGDLSKTMDALAAIVARSATGPVAPLSWRTLLADPAPSRLDLRRLLLVQPVLDFSALQPGARAIDLLRASASELGLTPENGVTVRLTGTVPLADEEFATVAEGAALNTAATLAMVFGLLFAALGSWRLVLAVMTTLLAGLALTTGLGLVMIGEFNLISVAFAVLFVGLGVDFSIQVAVRYRELRFSQRGLRAAVGLATRQIRRPILLAAASSAIGFFAFLPTSFRGVSELGLIAGVGMAIAFIASITLLPALIVLLAPPPESAPVAYSGLRGADRLIERHRRAILAVTALVFAAGLPLLAQLRFDSNPMNLRDERVESVATFLDLGRDPETNPVTLDVIAPDQARAEALAERLRALPEVARVVGTATFVPRDQEARLAAIDDAALLMDTVLEPVTAVPAKTPAELAIRLQALAVSLRQGAERAASGDAAAARSAERLADAFEALSAAGPERIMRVGTALSEGLPTLLARLRTAFSAQPLTREDLPAALREAWVAADGRTRLEIFPRGDVSDDAVMRRFAAAVRGVAPGATGVPVTIIESGKTVVGSFVTAAVLALAGIVVLLLVVLRSIRDVLVTLVPLVVAVMMSLQAAVLLGIQLNFANIIALPLMCGVSVAYHIYFVMAWREGQTDVLASSLTRAVLFSALTTAAAFGSLWLSSHPGTASMGKLLTVSLFFTLLAAFVFVPAFLGPPPDPQTPRQSP